MALTILNPEEGYSAIRNKAVVYPYPPDLEVFSVAGLDRIDLVSWLLPKSTAYAQPGTSVESIVFDPDGRLCGLAVALIDDDETIIWSQTETPLLPRAMQAVEQLGLDSVTITPQRLSAVAVEGPLAWEVIDDLISDPVSDLLFGEWRMGDFQGSSCRVLRVGTTAEYGYVTLIEPSRQDALLSAMSDAVQLLGGGMADSASLARARAEVNHPMLPAQAEGLTVFEAGLQWYLTLNRDDDYLGREALSFTRPERRTIAAVVTGTDAPPVGTAVYAGDLEVGHVQLSLPNLGALGGFCLTVIQDEYAVPGLELTAGGKPLRTVARPAVNPLSWVRPIGDRR